MTRFDACFAESTASGSSYEERDQHHDQPFPQHYWSTVGRSGQSRNSGIITRENSGSTATSEESAVDPALAYCESLFFLRELKELSTNHPRTDPLNRWGGGYRPGPYAHPAFWVGAQTRSSLAQSY